MNCESEAFEIGIRDQIEARYMATRTPEQLAVLEKMTDNAFCKHMETVLQCRLSILDRHKRIEQRRNAIAQRKEKRKKESMAARMMYVERDIRRNGEADKFLSERGKRGALAAAKVRGKAKV